MQHLAPNKSPLHLAAYTQPYAHGQGLLVRGVEAEEAQLAGVGPVVHRHQQLAAPVQRDLAVGDRGLYLHRLALACIGQAGDAGFVLVAQRQMQGQIDVAAQSEFEQGFLGGIELRGGGNHGAGFCLVVHSAQRKLCDGRPSILGHTMYVCWSVPLMRAPRHSLVFLVLCSKESKLNT